MRSMFTLFTLIPVFVSTLAMASNIGYSLADSTGGTIGGVGGGNFVGGYSAVTPNWSGTLGANGTTLTAAAATPAAAPTPPDISTLPKTTAPPRPP